MRNNANASQRIARVFHPTVNITLLFHLDFLAVPEIVLDLQLTLERTDASYF